LTHRVAGREGEQAIRKNEATAGGSRRAGRRRLTHREAGR
jgi:hypothetical protein